MRGFLQSQAKTLGPGAGTVVLNQTQQNESVSLESQVLANAQLATLYREWAGQEENVKIVKRVREARKAAEESQRQNAELQGEHEQLLKVKNELEKTLC